MSRVILCIGANIVCWTDSLGRGLVVMNLRLTTLKDSYFPAPWEPQALLAAPDLHVKVIDLQPKPDVKESTMFKCSVRR